MILTKAAKTVASGFRSMANNVSCRYREFQATRKTLDAVDRLAGETAGYLKVYADLFDLEDAAKELETQADILKERAKQIRQIVKELKS